VVAVGAGVVKVFVHDKERIRREVV